MVGVTNIWPGLDDMPLCSRLLECKCEVVESACPRILVVIGEAIVVGRSKELPLPTLGIDSAELNEGPWLVEMLVEGSNTDVGAWVDASSREGAIEFVSVGVDDDGTVDSGTDGNAGGDSAENCIVRFDVPNAGYAAGAFIPKSSASTHETMALLASAHINGIKLRFITLAPNL